MKKIIITLVALVIMVVSVSMILITAEEDQPDQTTVMNNSVGLMDVTVDEGI